eukprot:3618477-Prymnesium_polylepis.1
MACPRLRATVGGAAGAAQGGGIGPTIGPCCGVPPPYVSYQRWARGCWRSHPSAARRAKGEEGPQGWDLRGGRAKGVESRQGSEGPQGWAERATLMRPLSACSAR